MQAISASSVCAAAVGALQASRARGARSALQGRQLRGAASNGSRCRAFFKFGGNKDKSDSGNNDPAYFQGAKREDYLASDVQDYFMYMGMLASEGGYERCEEMLASGTAPVDLLLLMACTENDDGKVEELLASGANPKVTDLQGRSPLELTTKDEVKQLLQAALVAA
ncbi:hypothetical protein D9Q98_000947 [Chlorella vulgaris]|uniref:Uncharacterized protein n=1 Tax=Chlorella vulgaris TaxID=3077 RepID=A0A9D4Z244_CHLVU|nr:hypothetical protein D9Q98_000947 [Chlorella vulgaris]